MIVRGKINGHIHLVRDGRSVCGIGNTFYKPSLSPITCPGCSAWAAMNAPKVVVEPGEIVSYRGNYWKVLDVGQFDLRIQSEDNYIASPLINEVQTGCDPLVFVRTWVKGNEVRWYVGKNWDGNGFAVEKGLTQAEGNAAHVERLIQKSLRFNYRGVAGV